jgi:hypothetical protein
MLYVRIVFQMEGWEVGARKFVYELVIKPVKNTFKGLPEVHTRENIFL